MKQGRKPSRNHELQRVRGNIRAHANVYQRRGKLVKGPCAVCGTTEQIEKHHPDYRFKLVVTWLCRRHHKELHRILKGSPA